MSKFPVAENKAEILSVDELTEMFEGVLEEVEGDLLDASIMPALEKPELPYGLEAVIGWNETQIEGLDGVMVRWIDPKGPDDVTELTDIALAKYYGFLTRWRNYCRSEAARSKDKTAICKKHLSAVASSIRIYLRESKGLPANQVDDYLKLDPRYVQADMALLHASIFYHRCENRQESYGTLLFSLSREQSRRQGELREETATNSSSKWRRPLR